MQGYVETAGGLRPIFLDNIDYAVISNNAIVISYLGQPGLRNGNIAIKYTFSQNVGSIDPVLISDTYIINKFWDWVAEATSGTSMPLLNSYMPGFIIGSVQSWSINSYSGTQSYLVANIPDVTAACAVDWAGGFPQTNVVTTNTGGGYPVVGYQVWNQVVTTPEGTTGGDPLEDGTYCWLDTSGPGGVDPEPGFGQNAVGTSYFVTIQNGYIAGVELCPSDILNEGGAGSNAYYNGFPAATPSDLDCSGCGSVGDCYCYSGCGTWESGQFALVGVSRPVFDGISWDCASPAGAVNNTQNLTGARLFIQDSQGRWVPFSNTQPYIPTYNGVLFEDVSFDEFTIDWSTFMDPQGGIDAPTCTYAEQLGAFDTKKQWRINLVSSIIINTSGNCGGGGGLG